MNRSETKQVKVTRSGIKTTEVGTKDHLREPEPKTPVNPPDGNEPEPKTGKPGSKPKK